MYYYIKYIGRIAFYFYFSKIEINGLEELSHDDTPLIFAPNHQAAFLDAVLIGVYTKRPVHFLTRADVFNPISDFFFKRLHMMPIYRIRDGAKNLSKNQSIFENCFKLLKKKKNILIFPEGFQLGEYYLRPLTKGFYRIAKGAMQAGVPEVSVVPVGINYFNHDHSGHKLILNFGKPIPASQYIEVMDSGSTKSNYRKFREALTVGIKSQMIIPEYADDYPRKVACINRNAESMPFAQLKQTLKEGRDIIAPKTYPILKYLRPVLSIPNFPFHIGAIYLLNYKMEDPLFESSLKIGLLMIVLPLWLIISFFICCLVTSNLWFGTIVIAFQLAFLYMYSLTGRFLRS